MPAFSLDANIFIQAKNTFYAFDIAPVFWEWLESQAEVGNVFCISSVYDEIVEDDDDLATWLRARRDTFRVEITPDTQRIMADISNYVVRNYPLKNADPFLERADPWIIAHAKAAKCIVVTQEREVPDNSKKVKIPNICEMFDVKCIDLFAMMRQLNARFD